MNAIPRDIGPSPIQEPAAQPEPRSLSYRVYITIGMAGLMALAGGIVGWGAMATIQGAVIAPGVVAVKGKTKAVQHPIGGIVASIEVQDGDAVDAGALLIRLDDALLKQRLSAVGHRMIDDEAQLARLRAERDGGSYAAPGSTDEFVGPDEAAEIVAVQERLLSAGRARREGEVKQLQRQIDQLQETISGAQGLRDAKTKQMQFAQEELDAISQLVDKGYAAKTQALALERVIAEIEGEIEQYEADLSRAGQAIREAEIKISQVDREHREQLLADMARVSNDLSQAREERAARLDDLARTEIRAPVAGVVHDLAVHTIGGVIAPGEPILTIVPVNQPMVVEARVPVERIDEVNLGQSAVVHLTAFDRGTTPELNATVTEVSADRLVDQAIGDAWYPIIITISDDQLERLAGLRLVSGMPAEVFVTTEGRTALSYILKPFADQLNRAMRE